MPTDKQLYQALDVLASYCGFIPCDKCKVKEIVHCSVFELGDEFIEEEEWAAPMYYDKVLLVTRLAEEEKWK